MGDFSDDWLALRAPADSRARADALLAPLLADWPEPRTVIDLGAGTGANLRHLAPRLGPDQHWTCIDHDAKLLARLPTRTADWAAAASHTQAVNSDGLRCGGGDWSCSVRTHALDLAREPDRLELTHGALVTASALLDLVSGDWLQRLLGRAAAAHCPLLFALSYDGRCTLEPALPRDAEVIALVNAHQHGDKGFGPALGPSAASVAAAFCRHLGYRVTEADSSWVIGTDERDLQQALLDGWLQAADEMAPMAASRLRDWRRAREEMIDRGESRIGVGHRDLLALPAGAARGCGCGA